MKIVVVKEFDMYINRDQICVSVVGEDGEYDPYDGNHNCVTLKSLVHDLYEANCVPTRPPTMHEKDKSELNLTVQSLRNCADYLEEIIRDTAICTKGSVGHRD